MGAAVSMAVTLRGESVPAGALLKRVASTVVLIPLFAWVVLRAPAWVFALLLIGLSGVAVWELVRMFERGGQPAHGRLAVAAGVLVTASFWPGGSGIVPVLPVVTLSAAVAGLLSAPLWTGRAPAATPVALALLGVLYVSWFLGHGVLLHRLRDGPWLILFLVGVTWVGESAAYLVGSTIGRTRLAPAISPRKTVEGAVAQLVASVLGAALLAAWLLPGWTVTHALVAGALLGAVGQVGDLAESVIKRSTGVKDAGGLIPGHGGILDRVDSLLFNAPAFYYFVVLGVGP